MLTQHLTAAALFIIMAVLSTADFANAINDRSSLRGRSSAIANGSIDMWGEEPVTNGNSFNRHHQQQRNLQKREKQTTGQVSKVDIDRVRSSVNFFCSHSFPLRLCPCTATTKADGDGGVRRRREGKGERSGGVLGLG
jgi:hypothetical protein